MAVQLAQLIDGWQWVVVFIYGPPSPPLWEELWTDFVEVVEAFSEILLYFGENFNVTLEVTDRPNDSGGLDPRSEQFWACMAASELEEMSPSNCVYTWRSLAHPHSLFCLDRFLSSLELLMELPHAEVQGLPRPLSDHTPIMWQYMEGT